MSNKLDSDQGRRFVGPDLGLNFLQKYQQMTLRRTIKDTALTLTRLNGIRSSKDPDRTPQNAASNQGFTIYMYMNGVRFKTNSIQLP